MATLRLAEDVRNALHAALVEDQVVLAEMKGVKAEATAQPGVFRYRIELPVHRPLDTEFVELRPVRLFVRQAADGWELFAIEGLDASG